MDDRSIVTLFWKRDPRAVECTDQKYGPYCHQIAMNILNDREDARECVNDTYWDAWNAMPPNRPAVLSTFLGKITRRISIDRWRSRTAQKRGGGEAEIALQELGECVSGIPSAEAAVEHRELVAAIRSFLGKLPRTQRIIFLQRYWYLESVKGIAGKWGYTYEKTAAILRRTRLKLHDYLEQEGYL